MVLAIDVSGLSLRLYTCAVETAPALQAEGQSQASSRGG